MTKIEKKDKTGICFVHLLLETGTCFGIVTPLILPEHKTTFLNSCTLAWSHSRCDLARRSNRPNRFLL